MQNAMRAADVLVEAFGKHRGLLLGYARSIVRNGLDAEDVVQDAFERAWRSRDRFTGVDAAPWLFTITKHLAFDVLRARIADAVADVDRQAAPESLDSYVERNERARSLASAVGRLSPRYRAAFILHDIEGYSNRELAARLRLPYHTVRTWLWRARHQVRAGLYEVSKLAS
jgi:RNA polymerase sigma-70 factor, ECF subfamily